MCVRPRRLHGQRHVLAQTQRRGSGRRPPRRRVVPAVHLGQEPAQDRGLHLVQPRVDADRARTSACRASRGTAASAAARRPPRWRRSPCRRRPSPGRFLVGKNENVADVAVACRPGSRRSVAPKAWAASSIRAMPCRSASSRKAAQVGRLAEDVHGHRSARVRSVMAASAAAGSRQSVTGSMSANTGVAPRAGDRLGGREERVGGGHDLVAGADAERLQRPARARRCRWRRRPRGRSRPTPPPPPRAPARSGRG